jgi:hypothetical protein
MVQFRMDVVIVSEQRTELKSGHLQFAASLFFHAMLRKIHSTRMA